MINSPKRFWLVDHTLVRSAGHYLTYDDTVYRQAVAQGMDCHVLAHRDVNPDVLAVLPATPAMRLGHHDFLWRWLVRSVRSGGQSASTDTPSDPGFSKPCLLARCKQAVMPTMMRMDIAWASRKYYTDLCRGLPDDCSDADVLFAPTVDHRQLTAWAKWLSRFDGKSSPLVVLLMRYNYLDPMRTDSAFAPWVRQSFASFESLVRNRRIKLASDSRILAREYEQVTHVPVQVLPIPHVPEIAINGDKTSMQNGSVHFVSLGDARQEKGFDVLAQAILQLARENRLAHMRFTLQCPITSPVHEPMRQWIEQLRALHLPAIQLLDSVLSHADYLHLLGDADVVLLPYRRQVYHARTSGPLVEALAVGKPVIVTQQTWLDEQVQQAHTGLSVPDSDVSALTNAMVQMSDNHRQWRTQALAAAPAWRAYHNPTNFLKMLLD